MYFHCQWTGILFNGKLEKILKNFSYTLFNIWCKYDFYMTISNLTKYKRRVSDTDINVFNITFQLHYLHNKLVHIGLLQVEFYTNRTSIHLNLNVQIRVN